MIDLMQAAQDAVFAKLAAAVGPDQWLVRQHVPQNTEPPFQFVGAIDSEDASSKGEQFERITMQVVSVFRGEERGPLLDMMHVARTALDGQALEIEGANIIQVRFTTASASVANRDDGVTYAGVSTFEILAEPED